jgi:beta-glucanase (GH16 family)
MADKRLELAAKYPATPPEESCLCESRNVSLGLVASKQQYQYGFFQTSAKMASAVGVASSVWLQGATGEISMVENVEGATRTLTSGIHCFGVEGSTDVSSVVNIATSSNFDSTVEHVYGLDWQEGALKFYLNGVLIRTIEADDAAFGCMNQRMNMVFSVEAVEDAVVENIGESSLSVGSFQYWLRGDQKEIELTTSVAPGATTSVVSGSGATTSVALGASMHMLLCCSATLVFVFESWGGGHERDHSSLSLCVGMFFS